MENKDDSQLIQFNMRNKSLKYQISTQNKHQALILKKVSKNQTHHPYNPNQTFDNKLYTPLTTQSNQFQWLEKIVKDIDKYKNGHLSTVIEKQDKKQLSLNNKYQSLILNKKSDKIQKTDIKIKSLQQTNRPNSVKKIKVEIVNNKEGKSPTILMNASTKKTCKSAVKPTTKYPQKKDVKPKALNNKSSASKFQKSNNQKPKIDIQQLKTDPFANNQSHISQISFNMLWRKSSEKNNQQQKRSNSEHKNSVGKIKRNVINEKSLTKYEPENKDLISKQSTCNREKFYIKLETDKLTEYLFGNKVNQKQENVGTESLILKQTVIDTDEYQKYCSIWKIPKEKNEQKVQKNIQEQKLNLEQRQKKHHNEQRRFNKVIGILKPRKIPDLSEEMANNSAKIPIDSMEKLQIKQKSQVNQKQIIVAPQPEIKQQLSNLQGKQAGRQSYYKAETENVDLIKIIFYLLDESKRGFLSDTNCFIDNLTQQLRLLFSPILNQVKGKKKIYSERMFIEQSISVLKVKNEVYSSRSSQKTKNIVGQILKENIEVIKNKSPLQFIKRTVVSQVDSNLMSRRSSLNQNNSIVVSKYRFTNLNGSSNMEIGMQSEYNRFYQKQNEMEYNDRSNKESTDLDKKYLFIRKKRDNFEGVLHQKITN